MYLVFMFLTRRKFRRVSTWIGIALLFGLVNSACQRDYSFALDESQRNQTLDLASAQAYYRELQAREGDDITNRKHIPFEKGYWTQTRKSTVMEFPVVYNQRFSKIIYDEKNPLTEEMKKEIFRASFDRLVIMKDKVTGAMNHRLISFIPDIDYLRSKKNDISHNHINKLDADFSGYLVYKNWEDDRSLYYLRYENGKRTRYQPLRANSRDKGAP